MAPDDRMARTNKLSRQPSQRVPAVISNGDHSKCDTSINTAQAAAALAEVNNIMNQVTAAAIYRPTNSVVTKPTWQEDEPDESDKPDKPDEAEEPDEPNEPDRPVLSPTPNPPVMHILPVLTPDMTAYESGLAQVMAAAEAVMQNSATPVPASTLTSKKGWIETAYTMGYSDGYDERSTAPSISKKELLTQLGTLPEEEEYEGQLCCPVCFEAFGESFTTVCGHTFCKDCLRLWLEVEACVTCPTCRSGLCTAY